MSQSQSKPRTDELLSAPAPESLDDLRAEVERSTDAAEKKTPDPKLKPVYTFAFSWVAPDGQVFEGRFTTHVLTVRERQQAGVMRSRLGGGISPENLDSLTAELNLMVSHLAFSLESNSDRPEWSKDLLAIRHPALLQALYREVSAHEAAFLGLGANP